ncbi:UNKNOWN [Stylonychia lemnae]|uniref:Uncharacterized protein n=1 Tax=Stylonychia lemnae TaxID=5949 RepID=A0A078AZQ4_STYLE|nr:UNKNOWN [Stylonychia lemnae]|eukprot:CDW86283.1 UNKNOWN [Stylonychia lemnae]
MIFVTARINVEAGQSWRETGTPLNTRILQIIESEDIVIQDSRGEETGDVQTVEILQARNTGHTIYQVGFDWGGIIIKEVIIKIYVNQEFCLCVVEPCLSSDYGFQKQILSQVQRGEKQVDQDQINQENKEENE